MLMTLPLNESLGNESLASDSPRGEPQAGRPDSNSFDDTRRRVEEIVANRVREKGIKDELRRALYRHAVDGELQRFNGSASQPSRLRAAGRVAVCGFAAFVVVLWAIGPSTLDLVEAVLVAAGASLGLGILSLAIAAICDRLAGRHSDPADHQPMQPRKDQKALRRLF